MEKTREIFMDDEEATVVVSGEEQTLVSPRFDDEETLVARPVVPLGDADVPEASREHAAPESHTASAAPNARAYARRLPSRRSLLALVLCSVLVGGVLGGAGLYFYQRQSGDAQAPTTPATDATNAQGRTPVGAEQPAPAPSAEAAAPTPGAEAPDAATDTQPAPESNAQNEHADEGRADPDGDGAAPAREPESVPAAGAPKRGKKGAHDEEIERNTRRANPADSGPPVARADEREARRVDTIFYRQRRTAARDRARRQPPSDAERLRRIFEGAPE